MCLTLRNAVTVLDHQDGWSPAPGYTRHHIGNLGPGDWWFSGPDLRPRTVTEVHHHLDRIKLTDQYGRSYSYAGDAVISTAVPDPRTVTGVPTTRARTE